MLKGDYSLCIFLFVFMNFFRSFCQGPISPLAIPGQNALHVDYYRLLNYAFTAPVDNHINVTFTDGFTPNVSSYRSYTCLTQIQMQIDQTLQYFHIYVNSTYADRVQINIHIQGSFFARVGISLLTIDTQNLLYSSVTKFYKAINGDLNSTIPYKQNFAFTTPLTNYASSNLRLIPMLWKLRFNTYSVISYSFDFNPVFVALNNTHYSVTMSPTYACYLNDVKVSLLAIQTDMITAATYNRFIYFDLDYSTIFTYQNPNPLLLKKQNILTGISIITLNGASTGLTVDFSTDFYDQLSVTLNMITVDRLVVNSVLFYHLICPNNMQFSPDNQTCDCYNNTWMINYVCTDIVGCTSVNFLSTSVVCTFCDISKKYRLIGGLCQCNPGFNSTYLRDSICTQICGDGINIESQCDDGNTISGDGCSSTCFLQPGANCTKDVSGKSICKVTQNIQLSLVSIMKIDNQNQATLTFEVVNDVFPFDLNFLNSDISISNISNVQLYSVTSQGKEIQVTISYSKTIEGQGATFTFDFSNTQYNSTNYVINLQTIGKNQPLVCSNFLEAIKKISSGSSTVGVLGLIILILALPAPKYIGVQTVQIIQLFYFSLLLTNPISIWPPAYKALTPLKYSNGYSILLMSQNIQFGSNFSKKFNFLGLNYFFFNNNNIMVAILFIMCLSYFVINFIKGNSEKDLIEKYENSKQISEKKLLQRFIWMSSLIESCFKICFHFSMFLFLQVSASIFIQSATMKYFNSIITIQQLSLNTFLMVLSFVVILMFFMTNFKNLLLPSVQLKKLKTRYEKRELIHVKLNIIYLYIITILIMACNCLQPVGIPFSVFVLLYQLAYIIILLKVNPYKYSLRLHRFSLIFNNASFLLFLCLLSFNNYFQPEEIYQICLCYYVLGISAIIFTLSIIRLYYQYRYGNQLDDKIRIEDEKLQQAKQKARKEKQELELKEKIEQFEKLAKKRAQNGCSPIDLLYSKQNKYLYKNQCDEVDKQDLLQWLQTRINWSEQQKQKYYYERFTEKPQNWIKKQEQLQEDNKKLQSTGKKDKNKKQNKQVPKVSQSLQKIRENLRKQLKQKEVKKKQRKQIKKKQYLN